MQLQLYSVFMRICFEQKNHDQAHMKYKATRKYIFVFMKKSNDQLLKVKAQILLKNISANSLGQKKPRSLCRRTPPSFLRGKSNVQCRMLTLLLQVRVMDCFLMEGCKVLYRTALAILILYHRHMGESHN